MWTSAKEKKCVASSRDISERHPNNAFYMVIIIKIVHKRLLAMRSSLINQNAVSGDGGANHPAVGVDSRVAGAALKVVEGDLRTDVPFGVN